MFFVINIFKNNILVLLNIFFSIFRSIESSEQQLLFKIETFCDIINFFTVPSDQFKSYFFLSKKKKSLLAPYLTS